MLAVLPEVLAVLAVLPEVLAVLPEVLAVLAVLEVLVVLSVLSRPKCGVVSRVWMRGFSPACSATLQRRER